jgi:hypothetical protein
MREVLNAILITSYQFLTLISEHPLKKLSSNSFLTKILPPSRFPTLAECQANSTVCCDPNVLLDLWKEPDGPAILAGICIKKINDVIVERAPPTGANANGNTTNTTERRLAALRKQVEKMGPPSVLGAGTSGSGSSSSSSAENGGADANNIKVENNADGNALNAGPLDQPPDQPNQPSDQPMDDLLNNLPNGDWICFLCGRVKFGMDETIQNH